MALAHIKVTLSTTPTLLYKLPGGTKQRKIYIANRSSTNIIYIGDSSISASDGYPLLAQAATGVQHRAELELFGGDEVWGVSAATTSVVAVLVPGA